MSSKRIRVKSSFQGSREEKRKEKEALRIQIEQEQEERRLARERRNAEQVIKAKAELSGPKTVGKIDLDKKPETPKTEEEPKAAPEEPKVEVKEEPKEK